MPITTSVNLIKIRRTKIVVTIGPATETPEKIRELMDAGVNMFRLNMSHGDHAGHERVYGTIRRLAEEMNHHVAIMADLCGPKIRTGVFKDGQIMLTAGQNVTVTSRDVVGEEGLIPSQYEALPRDVKYGDRILLNDGNLELRVNSVEGTEISCLVVHGGVLKDHKGINLPNVHVSAPSLTPKDYEDAKFALDLGVDFLALSFVRKASDVHELKALVRKSGKETGIIAKIEKPEALEKSSSIIDASDGIMVARGDLGVELNPEEVPVVQSKLIQQAREQYKPVIVATQMLESMIEHARPTRAEVTDIHNAVMLGTDAVMLSAETATGAYPLEAVQMMDRIIRQTESYLMDSGAYGDVSCADSSVHHRNVANSVSKATALLSKALSVQAVMVLSQSGMSAATMSSARPAAPVVCITGRPETCRKMALLWSVIPVLSENSGKEHPNHLAREVAVQGHLAKSGEYVLLVRGFNSDPTLNVPSVSVLMV